MIIDHCLYAVICVTGRYSTTFAYEIHGNFNVGRDDPEWSDIQLVFSPIGFAMDFNKIIGPAAGYRKDVRSAHIAPITC